MLPPAYATASEFERHGFAAAVRERGLPADTAFADFGLDEVTAATVFARLHQQYILPARRAGAAVWLGGISLGGYVALGCAARGAAELAGLCLLAPYLGSHIITGEIARAGGLARWRAPPPAADADADADADEERRIWSFLQQPPLPIHLGLGREDRFLDRHRILADALPAAAVDIVPGGHDWPTWRRLWDNFLDERFF